MAVGTVAERAKKPKVKASKRQTRRRRRIRFAGYAAKVARAELVDGKFQRQFGEDKFAALPKQCRACPELRFCHGGCPKDRLIPAEGGKLNWLCEGYQRFFRETAPYFSAMAVMAGFFRASPWAMGE